MGYKPGTAPDKDRDLGLRGVPGETDMSQAIDPNALPSLQTPGAGTGGLY